MEASLTGRLILIAEDEPLILKACSKSAPSRPAEPVQSNLREHEIRR